MQKEGNPNNRATLSTKYYNIMLSLNLRVLRRYLAVGLATIPILSKSALKRV